MDRQTKVQILQFQAIASIGAKITLEYNFFGMILHLVRGWVWSHISRFGWAVWPDDGRVGVYCLLPET